MALTMTDEQELRAYYGPVEVPPCRLCGAPLTIGSIGGGKATKWACSAADFKTMGKDWLDHYSKSRWTDYRRGGDERVIAALDALDATRAQVAASQAECAELRAALAVEVPWGAYLVWHKSGYTAAAKTLDDWQDARSAILARPAGDRAALRGLLERAVRETADASTEPWCYDPNESERRMAAIVARLLPPATPTLEQDGPKGEV